VMEIIKLISSYAIPVFIFIVLGYGYIKGVKVYDVFIEGAKEGLTTALRVLPYMVAMFVAIGIFRASGAMDVLIAIVTPAAGLFGIPVQILPLAIIRPLSGIASTSMLAEILRIYSPDSYLGRLASTMMGSTETIFYTISVYYGSIGVKKIRYTLWAALLADLAGLMASILICNLVFDK